MTSQKKLRDLNLQELEQEIELLEASPEKHADTLFKVVNNKDSSLRDKYVSATHDIGQIVYNADKDGKLMIRYLTVMGQIGKLLDAHILSNANNMK